MPRPARFSMRRWAWLLPLLLMALRPAGAQTLTTQVPPHDARSRLFFDHFAGPFDAGPTPAHRWMTCLPYGGHCVRTQALVPEAQCYVDASTNTDPFSTPARIPGVTDEPSLVITADRSGPGGNPCGTPYTSGIVTTFGSFAFQYGYVEARIKAPGGSATWPGFWLLPVDNRGDAEIDILEIFGYDPAHMQATIIAQNRKPQQLNDYTIVPLPDPGGWHTYGLDWGPETTTWFLDGVAVKQVRTPPEAKVPMYVLVNLALYGEGSTNMAKEHALPTPPPPHMPARMVVSYVGVWRTPATR